MATLALMATAAALALLWSPSRIRTSSPSGSPALRGPGEGPSGDLPAIARKDPERPAGAADFAVRSRPLLDLEIRRLLAAVAEDPEDAASRTRLTEALVNRARDPLHAADLVVALDVIEGAGDPEPPDTAILRLRAVARTQLGLRGAARSSWGRVLEFETDPSMAEEARRNLDDLDQPTLDDRWRSGDRAALLEAAAAGDLERSAELIAAHPTTARLWIEEERLPEWAKAEAAGDALRAHRQLSVLHTLAGALARALHDRTMADTLARIDASTGPTRQRLVHGLELFGEAMASYRSFGSEDKNRLLDRAAEALDESGLPLAGWARLYRAVGWHRSDPEVAEAKLTALAAATDVDRQPILAANIDEMLGINDLIQNRLESALEHDRQARDRFFSAGETQAGAFAHLVVGETLRQIGERERSWESLLAALRSLSRIGDHQRLHATLVSGVEELFAENRFGAARVWVEEEEANAESWGMAIGRAEAYLQKGRLLAHEGDRSTAQQVFSMAREQCARILDPQLQRRTLANLELYEAEALLGDEPQRALEDLERARPAMVEIGYRFQLPRLETTAARAYLTLGETDRAMQALHRAIDEEEAIRTSIRDESRRATAFEGAQGAFDTLIGLELAAGDETAAFADGERARSRVLLDLVAAQGGTSAGAPLVGLDQLEAKLPEDVDLLELTILPTELVLWRVERDGHEIFRSPLSAEELRQRVDRLRAAIDRNASVEKIQARASELRRILLGPIEADLAPGRRLIVVPDRFLGRVPYGVLFDAARGRYLIEDHPLLVAPSASTYLATRARRLDLGGDRPLSVVAVGANHPPDEWLPTADGEATSIGDLYPQATVLTGQNATKGAFLAAAADADVLHFAGHGMDNPAAPRRSRLLFWPAAPDDPGELFADEVVRRRLPRTRLAVLAACRSVGGSSRGRETVSGMTAAFLAAGVPTVTASLWDADDRVTGPMMEEFHRYLRQGLVPSEALRRAQLTWLRSAPDFRSPRFWAGFEVVGAD